MALTVALAGTVEPGRAQNLDQLAQELDRKVEANRKLTQVIVDKLFSFSELGHQEFETQAYLTNLLRQNGFRIETGIAGVRSSWWATWGSGRPVIALGSDIDGIPKASQKPGVAYHDPIVPGAPGHGEGHNSGQAVNVTAALAVKEIMEREGIEGTLILWPGVAEEQLASKAWYVREGWFEDVDAVIFTHVGNNLAVSWGGGTGTGLISVEISYNGEAAHGARAWGGRSALDGITLLEVGWNFRREHTRPVQRSHMVITDGGDQPNVVPPRASGWFFIREMDYEHIRENFDKLLRTARGAELMTDTEMEYRIIGAAYPRHYNRPIAEAVGKHIEAVGLPQWSEADQALARAVQRQVDSDETDGLNTELAGLSGPPEVPRSGGSDDIGDIAWNVPTVRLGFPSNIPGLQGHHWSNAIAMATPIAHKGATAGAKVLARSTLQLFLDEDLLAQARDYFRNVQTKDQRYTSMIEDYPPPTFLNEEIMRRFKPELEQYYYDETRYDTYLEQLGIEYPTLRTATEEGTRQ